MDINKPADVTFVTFDDPEAGGREALHGERRYTFFWKLEDGRIMSLHTGQESFDLLRSSIQYMITE